MSERITSESEALLTGRSPLDEEQKPPRNPRPPGTIRFVDVQVYDVPAEDLPAGLFSVERALEPEDDETPELLLHDESQCGPGQWEPSQETLENRGHSRSARTRLRPLLLIFAVLCVLFAGAVSVVSILPLLAPSATVTIIPDFRQITTATTVRVTTATAQSALHQLEGRALASVTVSQTQTVPTTGTGHQEARAAHGLITFYNAAPFSQTVAAGVLLTGADGVQVVTDQDAVIPAVAYPTLGQVTVPAHTVTTGPGGNIRAGDIYGLCCRLNVSAVNSAFREGQEARSYRMVTSQDIHEAAAGLKASLEQSVQAALQTQVQSDETLITPLPCKRSVKPDHAAGDEAAQVEITVDETCTGEVYHTQAYQVLIKQIVSQQVMKQLGEGYKLSGDIQATIDKVTIKDHGVFELAVTGKGIWMYQFGQEQLQRIKSMIAGKREAQAKFALLHVPGVQTASITFSNATIIPTEARNIHLVLLEMIS